jgi:hypothetical protein
MSTVMPKMKKASPPKAVVLNDALFAELRKRYPRRRTQLALAAHCTKVAQSGMVEGELDPRRELEPALLADWLLERVGDVPEVFWNSLRDAVFETFELLAEDYPKDVGLFATILMLSNPGAYEEQQRFIEQERLVELLMLEGKADLMRSVGLPLDCVAFYGGAER